jgi:recombinational DNA repair protein RecR
MALNFQSVKDVVKLCSKGGKMKKKTVCLFCAKPHEKTPPICEIKGEIMTELVEEHGFSAVVHAIEQGVYDLEGEAQKVLKNGDNFMRELKKI